MFSKKELAKQEPIQCFVEGQSLSTAPATITTREQCREWKKLGTGYFISSGKQFRLTDLFHPAVVAHVSSRFGAIRDASVSPGERVIRDYVDNEPYAVAIIDIGWVRASHAQVLSA